MSLGKGTGRGIPEDLRLVAGMTVHSRGEASPSPSSKLLVGPGKKRGVSGGLVGMSPKALCVEAPKGQPVIRSESLKAVGGEDPKGHPMIHGC